MPQLTRKITFTSAYDRSQEKPNYGIHGMVIGFQLHGPEGVVNWNYHTGIYLEHNRKAHEHTAYHSSCYGNEICAHGTKPFAGSDGPNAGCNLLGDAPCHSAVLTGGLYGQELGERLLTEGDAPIWAELEAEYNKLFPQLELKGI